MSSRVLVSALLAVLCLGACGPRRDTRDAAMPVGPTPVLTAGAEHVCYATSRGAPRCVGFNLDGQLGDGTFADRAHPVAPVGLPHVDALVAGERATCAIEAGALSCWGRNDRGQLGLGDRVPRPTPARVDLPGRVRAVALGPDFSCVVLEDGRALCAGAPEGGRLGRTTDEDALRFAPVAGLPKVVDVTVGRAHACARTEAGAVHCWGEGALGQLGERPGRDRASPVVVPGIVGASQLDAGGDATCVVARGRVSCFGSSEHGQLGDGSRGPGIGLPAEVPGLSNVLHVTVGATHTCALLGSGAAKCWGEGRLGQLGRGVYESFPRPTAAMPLDTALGLAAGDGYTCAVRDPRVLSCTGTADHGQFGMGGARRHATFVDAVADLDAAQLAPAVRHVRPLGQARTARGLALGENHLCQIEPGGTVRCVGRADGGETGSATSAISTSPRRVVDLDGVEQLDARAAVTCAVRAGGELSCFGHALFGLGQAGVHAASVPVVVDGVTQAASVRVESGFSCVRLTTGHVACFGEAALGQLGHGSLEPSERAVEVEGIADATEVVTASTFACALRAGGTVSCWGRGESALLGARGRATAVPRDVGAFPAAHGLVARGRVLCFLDGAGRPQCFGPLPGVRPARATVPYPVEGLRDQRALALGDGFLLALGADGAVRCVGDNAAGVCGVDPTTTRIVAAPVVVAPASPSDPTIGLAAHARGACLERASGQVECWGGGGLATFVLRAPTGANAGARPTAVLPAFSAAGPAGP